MLRHSPPNFRKPATESSTGKELGQRAAGVNPAEWPDSGDKPLDFPTNGGHPVKGVYSPLGGPTWQDHDAPTPPSSRSRQSSSSPSRATPSPRLPARSASTRT